MSLTYERVRELFDYREDGFLIWNVCKAKRIKIGDVAGSFDKTHGYHIVGVNGRLYKAHRLIWLWHHGYMPEGELDHINKIKYDNRIENLREASSMCNKRNISNPKDNKTGVKGVRIESGVWQARITVNRKQYHLGSHKDFDEAALHRLAAEQCLGWAGCDSSSPSYRYAVRSGLIQRRQG